MKPLLVFALGALVMTGLPAPERARAVVIEEEGALYLEHLLPRPVRIAVPRAAPIYFKLDLERSLGVLRPGQTVELQAIREDGGAYRVRGLAQQGQVAGWVEPRFLPPLRRDFLEAVQANAARQRQVQGYIARNEVAVNMTRAEVIAALGRPARKNSRVDGGGRSEVWEFIRYERIPRQVQGYDAYGRYVTNTVFVREPAGQLSVVFAGDLVASLEQSEGVLNPRARIVTAPLALGF